MLTLRMFVEAILVFYVLFDSVKSIEVFGKMRYQLNIVSKIHILLRSKALWLDFV